MSLPHPIELLPCTSEACLNLQQIIEDESTQADDTLDLTTAFLIIKDIRIDQSLQSIPEPATLAGCLLNSLNQPFSQYLSNLPTYPWFNLSLHTAQARIVELLSHGASAEPPVFTTLEQAFTFTQTLIQLIGEPCHCLTNVKRYGDPQFPDNPGLGGRSGFSVFQVGHCWDEGVVLISSQRIGLLWLLGYD